MNRRAEQRTPDGEGLSRTNGFFRAEQPGVPMDEALYAIVQKRDLSQPH